MQRYTVDTKAGNDILTVDVSAQEDRKGPHGRWQGRQGAFKVADTDAGVGSSGAEVEDSGEEAISSGLVRVSAMNC